MQAHFFRLTLRTLGRGLWLEVDLSESRLGPDHALRHLRPVRFQTESEVLRLLHTAHIGQWTRFPQDGIYATLSATQLRTLGFRGHL